ncbi:MAG: hypothetical protein DMG23_12645 [Acidobacteria bacterium]|nr:MAG: hypothetical protein DMG23_12645 [Acidobacteriota bacterium]
MRTIQAKLTYAPVQVNENARPARLTTSRGALFYAALGVDFVREPRRKFSESAEFPCPARVRISVHTA